MLKQSEITERLIFIVRGLLFGAAFLILSSSAASAQTVERTVPANSRTAVGGVFLYEPGRCYVAPPIEATVKVQPANGNVVVAHEMAIDDKGLCPGLKVKGPVFVYAPKRGFTGVDEFTVEYPWRRSSDELIGTKITSTYCITVK